MKNFIQPGNTIPWTNATGTDVASGSVVPLKHTIGVACVDIANGANGEVALSGVFTLPKVSGAVIAAGEKLSWDASVGEFDDSSAAQQAGDILGAAIAVEAVGAGPTSVKAKLVGPGALT